MAKETVLFLTHKVNKWVKDAFTHLKKTAGDRRVIMLYNGKNHNGLINPNVTFSDDEIWSLNYPKIGNKLVPGHVHFPVFKYFKEHKPSNYYWVVEYDVRFTGQWSYLFDYFKNSGSALLSSLLRRYREHPEWRWWPLNHPEKSIEKGKRIASFSPIYRISREAAIFLDEKYRSGWKGHFEVSCPTLLYNNGFEIQDFGGEGEFVKKSPNKFYTNKNYFNHLFTTGTFRYRPNRNKAGYQKNKLYHPVKPGADGGIIHNLRYIKHRIHRRYN